MSINDTIKRCPFCGHDDAHTAHSAHGYYCCCDECGAFGPDSQSEKDAIKLWNVPVSVIEDLNFRLKLERQEI